MYGLMITLRIACGVPLGSRGLFILLDSYYVGDVLKYSRTEIVVRADLYGFTYNRMWACWVALRRVLRVWSIRIDQDHRATRAVRFGRVWSRRARGVSSRCIGIKKKPTNENTVVTRIKLGIILHIRSDHATYDGSMCDILFLRITKQ